MILTLEQEGRTPLPALGHAPLFARSDDALAVDWSAGVVCSSRSDSFLLPSCRMHQLKGAKEVIFYSLPTFPHFYAEVSGLHSFECGVPCSAARLLYHAASYLCLSAPLPRMFSSRTVSRVSHASLLSAPSCSEFPRLVRIVAPAGFSSVLPLPHFSDPPVSFSPSFPASQLPSGCRGALILRPLH